MFWRLREGERVLGDDCGDGGGGPTDGDDARSWHHAIHCCNFSSQWRGATVARQAMASRCASITLLPCARGV